MEFDLFKIKAENEFSFQALKKVVGIEVDFIYYEVKELDAGLIYGRLDLINKGVPHCVKLLSESTKPMTPEILRQRIERVLKKFEAISNRKDLQEQKEYIIRELDEVTEGDIELQKAVIGEDKCNFIINEYIDKLQFNKTPFKEVYKQSIKNIPGEIERYIDEI